MAKNRNVKLGKFSKKRVPDKENQYIWSMKQVNKLSGAKSRELKQILEQAVAAFLADMYGTE